jgi:hypothetical protein
VGATVVVGAAVDAGAAVDVGAGATVVVGAGLVEPGLIEGGAVSATVPLGEEEEELFDPELPQPLSASTTTTTAATGLVNTSSSPVGSCVPASVMRQTSPLFGATVAGLSVAVAS